MCIILFDLSSIFVFRQEMFCTYPISPESRLIKSPGSTFLLNKICNPANMSVNVSFKANETAKPPTPRAVNIGAMDILIVSNIISIPIV